MHMHVPVGVYMHYVHVEAYRGQRRVSDPLELELQVVVSCLRWMLGTEPMCSARAVSTLSHQVLSSDFSLLIITIIITFQIEEGFTSTFVHLFLLNLSNTFWNEAQ